MSEQQKIFRIIRLIRILADRPSKTALELVKILEVSRKTVYRDLDSIEKLGYLLDKDERDAYFIFEADQSESTSFEPEELQLLNQLIGAIEGKNPLKESLRKKLFLSSALVPLSEELMDMHLAKIVHRLSNAIEDNKQCRLIHYRSASSDVPQNCLIEPISLTKNNEQLAAFDLDKQEMRHFKLKRIEDVEILEMACSHINTTITTDIFGFPAEKSILVKLLLSTRAYQLLIEEFPDARPFTSHETDKSKRNYRFVYEARSLVGIGRFILGLPGEIVVDSPVELKEYLKKRISEFTLS